MKTLIFSIYISRHGVYQWEVKMFLNSLLTWSLGRDARKCCLAGVRSGGSGILGAARSWLHGSRPAGPAASLVTWALAPGSLAVYSFRIAGVPDITPDRHSAPLSSAPWRLGFPSAPGGGPRGWMTARSPSSRSLRWRSRRFYNNVCHTKSRFNVICLVCKK